MDSITGAVDKGTPEIVEQSKALLKRMNAASDAVNDLLKPENRAAVGAILADVQRLSSELHTTKESLDSTLADLNAMTKQGRPIVESALIDLQSVLQTLSGHRRHRPSPGFRQPQRG